MKCPNCGHWNRASFPRCYHCGAPLTPEDAPVAPGDASDAPAPASKLYIQVNEEGVATPAEDERDKLAIEMKNLMARKERGERERQRLRRDSTAQGIAPAGRSVQTMTGRSLFPPAQRTSYESDEPVEGDVRPDAIPVPRTISYDEYDEPHSYAAPRSGRSGMSARHMKVGTRRFGFFRFARVLAVVLLIGGVGLTGYQFLFKPLVLDQREPPLQERAIISPSILNDMPAHLIRLPAPEGTRIFIKELHNGFDVVGGYATIEVEDYIWYESMASVTQETAPATLTAYINTVAGEQKLLGTVSYEVDIPLSPLTLVSPDTGYDENASGHYSLQFEVARNSTLFINGEDISDLVNNQNGLINYNVDVAPSGENKFTIVTRSQYCRENSATIIIYREPQEIRLDLMADLASRYSPSLVEDKSQPADSNGKYPMKEDPMVIRANTVTWADIEIKSPYANLDLSQLRVDGSFSFEPVFTKIGTNTIIIEASAPGRKTSVVTHDVYYVPIASIYTRKAWDMYTNYNDFLNNSQTRIANTTIYICQGTITQLLSEKPQLAVLALKDNPSLTVLIENYSNDTWVLGQDYRIYADAYGIYNGMPRLNGRYTYERNW